MRERLGLVVSYAIALLLSIALAHYTDIQASRRPALDHHFSWAAGGPD
jgi:hypothetical protein